VDATERLDAGPHFSYSLIANGWPLANR